MLTTMMTKPTTIKPWVRPMTLNSRLLEDIFMPIYSPTLHPHPLSVRPLHSLKRDP